MKRRQRGTSARQAGFSLVELLISMTLLGVIMTGLTGVIVSMQRTYISQRERARAQETLQAVQMTVATALRAAGANWGGTSGLDPDPLNHGRFDNIRLVSDFNPLDGDVSDLLEDVQIWVGADTLFVRWQAGGTPQPLAYPVNDLLFQYYANDGTEMTVPSQIVGATRVRFILEAPLDGRAGITGRLESFRLESWWVHLRNRG